MSNFEEYAGFMLDFAKNNPDYSFVLKPHPALKNSCAACGFMTEAEYDSYMDEWNGLENASVYTDGAYFDIFKTSDVLVTDCSSFLAEYFPSKKPVILLDRPARAPFDEFGRRLEKGFYKVQTPLELKKLLNLLLTEKKDSLKDIRLSLLKNEFFLPEKSSSETIIKYLTSMI